jgi:heme O synthase-like polyprenyltransferase
MSANIALRNKILNDYGTAIGTGTLTIYSGTPPANADTALSGNTALAAHTLAGFAAASAGSMSANAIADDTIDATGTATFARIVSGSYTEQLTLGTSGAQVIVSTTSYVAGGTSQIISVTVTKGA